MKHNTDFDLHHSTLATIDVNVEGPTPRMAKPWWLLPFVVLGGYFWFLGLSAALSLF